MQLQVWRDWVNKQQHLCCCLLAFSFPFPFQYAAICLWLLVICWVIKLDYLCTLRGFIRNPGFLFSTAFFILYAVSYFYSEDKEQSVFDIVQKLSFILLPLLVGAGMTITRRIWEDILLAFIIGITFVGFCCMMLAYLLFRETGDSEVLFYHKLVTGLDANAVYMAWYTLFSMSALLLFRWQQYFRRHAVILKWLCIGIQLLFFILLSSRMLLVTFCVITIPMYLGLLFSNLRFSKIKIVGTVLVSILLIVAIAFTKNPIRQRFDDVTHNDIHEAFLPDYHNHTLEFTNLTLRLFVWRMGVENLNEYHLWWTGAGNGDVHTLQNHRMARYGIKDMDDKTHTSPMYNVDLHNTYLQTLLAVGIPGLIALLLILFSPLAVLRLSGDKRLFFVFFFSSSLFMLQEAVFQTQAGIIYYLFFNTIFWQLARQSRIPAATAP